MVKAENEIHIASESGLEGNRLVMNHCILDIAVVNHLIMSIIGTDSEPVSLLEIDPVAPEIDSGDVAGIAGPHYITPSERQFSKFISSRRHSNIEPDHLPASRDIKAIDTCRSKLRRIRFLCRKASGKVPLCLKEPAF